MRRRRRHREPRAFRRTCMRACVCLCPSVYVLPSVSFRLCPFIYVLPSVSFRLCPSVCVLPSVSFRLCLTVCVLPSVSFRLCPSVCVLPSVPFRLLAGALSPSSGSFAFFWLFCFLLTLSPSSDVDSRVVERRNVQRCCRPTPAPRTHTPPRCRHRSLRPPPLQVLQGRRDPGRNVVRRRQGRRRRSVARRRRLR